MYKVDNNRCKGCGVCVDVCPPGAITLKDDTAMIDQDLCTQCGNCAAACPADAIYSLKLASAAPRDDVHNHQEGR